MELGLSGKIALVSGSNRGTGQIIAGHLVKEGATVIAHGPETDSAKHLLETEQAHYAVWGNLETEEGCQQIVQQAMGHAGQVDILINNYGTAVENRWFQANTEDWLDMYQKNVLSAARLIRLLAPQMKTLGWGRIIQLGTIGSTQPNALRPAYYAAKGALATMSVSLAKELSDTGITVNTISPGYIRTPEIEAAFWAKARKEGWEEDWETLEKRIVTKRFPNPCGRIATREEVADLVCFIASERAGFINGQNIRIDGGALGITQ